MGWIFVNKVKYSDKYDTNKKTKVIAPLGCDGWYERLKKNKVCRKRQKNKRILKRELMVRMPTLQAH